MRSNLAFSESICSTYNFFQGSKFFLKDCGYVSGSGASGARFGTVIAELGDVDGDGFKGTLFEDVPGKYIIN